MTDREAKNVINLLCQEWKIKKKDFFFEIINYLDKNIDKKISFSNEFEFSLIEGDSKIRLLHLNFWQPILSFEKIKRIIKKREETITSIFRKLSLAFNCQYNLPLLISFLKFNRVAGFWPIQFGLEYQKKSQPKIKVYLSINKDKFSLKKFCNDFNLNYKILIKEFKDRKFDTIAIDFLSDGEYGFKFYPLTGINNGLLYRVSKNSEFFSVKMWQRFPQGLTVKDIENSNFIILPLFIKNIIAKNKFKIFYLSEENNKRGIYFR